MEVVRRIDGVRYRPILLGAPAAAMVHAPGGVLCPAAATHDEEPYRWLIGYAVLLALEPGVEPAQSDGQVVGRKIAVERRGGAEVDVTRIGQRTIAMGPGTEDQPHRTLLASRQADVVLGRRARIGIVPGRHVDHRRVDELIVVAGRIDADLLPEVVEVAVLPLIVDVVLIFGHRRQRRMSAFPWHAREP